MRSRAQGRVGASGAVAGKGRKLVAALQAFCFIRVVVLLSDVTLAFAALIGQLSCFGVVEGLGDPLALEGGKSFPLCEWSSRH